MNYLKTAILLAAMTAMLVFFGGIFGGKNGAVIALVIAGVMNFVMYWWSDSIVLRMYSAKEAVEAESPGLYASVRSLAASANMPVPRIYIIRNETPNAFATGRNPSHAAVAVTTGIMGLLTTEELRGVLAHELAHVRNRDILISTVAATLAGAIGYLSHMAYFAALFGGRSRNDDDNGSSPFAAIVMMIVGPLAAAVIQMAISRSREFGADAGGAAIAGTPLSLANALRKLDFYNKKMPMEEVNQATAHMFIVSPLSGGGMLRLFSTHPPIEERIKRLQAMVGR